MYKKLFKSILFFILLTTICIAQSPNDFKVSRIKILINGIWEYAEGRTHNLNEIRNFRFNSIIL